MEKIYGIVPAAGLSKRMGTFKPLIEIEGESVIRRTVKSLLKAHISSVIVVTGYRSEDVEKELSGLEGVSFVHNPNPNTTDMLTSIKLGLLKIPDSSPFLVLPGDMPFVTPESIRKLIKVFREKEAKVAVALYNGLKGHPALFAGSLRGRLLEYEGDNGLKGFIESLEERAIGVETSDRGTTLDLDSPRDLAEAKKTEVMMKDISKSVVRKDHEEKITGRSKYVADYDGKGVLTGRLVRSPKAHAALIRIEFPKMPKGYLTVTADDVPGVNEVHIVKDDTPVFAKGTVEYIGEPVAMIVGPDRKVVDELVRNTNLVLEELEPVLDIEKSDIVFFDYHYEKGDAIKAFKEADKIYEETFTTGYQEQAYLETQGMMGEIDEKGRILIHGSMQCVYYVHNAVKKVLGERDFHIRQDATGGGFGGKEAWPSIVASEVAVATYKAGKPVRLVFDRREDLEFTSKRHPSKTHYRVALKDGRVTAMDINVKFNAGAYTTLSAVVLQRGLICADGVYNIENLQVNGKALKTNTVPNGAYRGFGAPQTFFPVETIMNHIAKDLGEEPLDFKRRHLVKKGDATSTSGVYHFPVPLPEMIDEVVKASNYYEKRKKYSEEQTGRYRRGIGISMHFHGAGFTGAGERDLIKAVAKLKKHKDGTVQVLAANGEIGQGLRTTFPKIVAHELGIPLDRVYYDWPDTLVVPDSGPTVASRSLMVVGELLRRLAIKLKEIWVDGEEQEVEERFREPSFVIPFNMEIFQGDAYPTYAWGVQAVEIEIDSASGLMRNVGTWASFDVGTPTDIGIVMGQMEGGLLQGLGYSSMEKMDYDKNGRIRNNNFSDYLIPTSMDVPNMNVMMHVEEYPDGPYGAKGAGELPLVGVPAAYVEACSQALGGIAINHIPFTQEDALKEISKED